MWTKLWEIFFSFLKVGTFGFGGGQAALPLIEAEVVDGHAWLTTEQFSDYLAMGNTLPGPIATKMSIIIGYDMLGYLGALAALLGMLIPSSVAILVLFNLFLANKDQPFVKGMQVAAKPVVAVLIFGVAFNMFRKSAGSLEGLLTTNSLIVIGIFIVSLTLVMLAEFKIFEVHPALIIVTSLLIGGFFIR